MSNAKMNDLIMWIPTRLDYGPDQTYLISNLGEDYQPYYQSIR